MEYTKGRWRLGSLDDEPFARSSLSIYQEDGRRIAEVSREGFMAFEEAEANAHLIAAAPDLYEALKAGLPIIKYVLEHITGLIGEENIEVGKVVRQQEQALAKANPNSG